MAHSQSLHTYIEAHTRAPRKLIASPGESYDNTLMFYVGLTAVRLCCVTCRQAMDGGFKSISRSSSSSSSSSSSDGSGDEGEEAELLGMAAGGGDEMTSPLLPTPPPTRLDDTGSPGADDHRWAQHPSFHIVWAHARLHSSIMLARTGFAGRQDGF
jgi:hypothetical protein